MLIKVRKTISIHYLMIFNNNLTWGCIEVAISMNCLSQAKGRRDKKQEYLGYIRKHKCNEIVPRRRRKKNSDTHKNIKNTSKNPDKHLNICSKDKAEEGF